MSRDPRIDPQPGDSVIFGPQWQLELYAVIKRTKDKVYYQIGPMRAVLQCSLTQWKEWSAGGDIWPAPKNETVLAQETTRDASIKDTNSGGRE